MIQILCLVVVISGLYLLIHSKNKPKKLKLPPGPWNFPILGNLTWQRKFPWKHFTHFGKKYGPLVHLKMGKTRVFLLNDIPIWKEAYRRPELSRHPGKIFETVLKNKSIIFGNGNRDIKNYMSKQLNEFGRHSLEDLTLKEIHFVLDKFKSREGDPIEVQSVFAIPTVNMLWTLLFGERIEEDDDAIYRIAQAVTTSSTNSSFLGRQSFLTMIPYITKIFPSLHSSRRKFIERSLLNLISIIKTRIQDRAKTRRHFELQTITDAYLDEISRADPDSSSFFGQEETHALVYTGLFVAAVDSTSTCLEWLLLFLATNPKVQEKFQNEIDGVIGSRKPSLIDRENMPYSTAVIQEMFRLSVVDITQFHQAKEDTTLMGYDIPKGSILLPNTFGINRDADIWDEPNSFRPERFFDENGNLQKSDKFISFGCGRRACLGESMARSQIFLFATSIFQRFEIRLFGIAPPFEGSFGFLHHPQPFQVKVFERSIRCE